MGQVGGTKRVHMLVTCFGLGLEHGFFLFLLLLGEAGLMPMPLVIILVGGMEISLVVVACLF